MTDYLLLDGLTHREAIVVNAALDLPLLSARGPRITSDDRLVVVSRDPERAWASVTVNGWLRASRAVFVLTPAAALTWDALRAIPERRQPMAVQVPSTRSSHGRPAIERLDLTHVGADWTQTKSHADLRPVCALCGLSISPAQHLACGDMRAHMQCVEIGASDLLRLAKVPKAGMFANAGASKSAGNERRALRRLAAGGYLTTSEVDGVVMYKRAKAHVGG